MGRHLENWLDSYLEYTQNTESPEKIHFWTSLSILSASTQRQIFMDRSIYTLYPNLYVIIVADSATVRKTSAMNIGFSILKEAVPNLQYVQDKMTPESLVRHLNQTKTVVNPNGSALILPDSSIFIYARELATLFGYEKLQGSRMAILLTEGYDCNDSYSHMTVKDSLTKIDNLYFVLLTATAPENLKVLPSDAVGGFLGRSIIVKAHERRSLHAWPEKGDLGLRQKLVEDLKTISILRGEMIPTPEAKEVFTLWYAEKAAVKAEDKITKAFMERCHDHTLKFAMLVSLAQRDALVITEEDMKIGIGLVETIIPELAQTTAWLSPREFNQNRAKVLDLLKNLGGLATRSQILRASGLSSEELESVTRTLGEEGTITSSRAGGATVYKLII